MSLQFFTHLHPFAQAHALFSTYLVDQVCEPGATPEAAEPKKELPAAPVHGSVKGETDVYRIPACHGAFLPLVGEEGRLNPSHSIFIPGGLNA